MYKISNDFNLTRLEGASVQQICFTKNTISLFFEQVGFITIEGKFILINDSGDRREVEVFPVNADFGLLNLIEQKIEKVYPNENRSDLIINFDNGYTVMLIGDEKYESFLIKLGDDEARV